MQLFKKWTLIHEHGVLDLMENSGLRKDIEYKTQATFRKKNHNNEFKLKGDLRNGTFIR